jgi:hypothetical protein
MRVEQSWPSSPSDTFEPRPISGYIPAVADQLADLSDAQKAWLLHSESLWRRAHSIAKERPELDVGDLYHSLRCLELAPAERLARGLSRGRLGAHRR